MTGLYKKNCIKYIELQWNNVLKIMIVLRKYHDENIIYVIPWEVCWYPKLF